MYTIVKKVIIVLILIGLAMSGLFAADPVSPKAYELWTVPSLGLSITNSMVTSWVFSLILIVVIRLAVQTPQLVPNKGQAVVESLVEGLRNIMEPIVGPKMIKRTFPLLLGFFIFILINNWSGLLPGVAAFGTYDEHGHLLYFFRPGNADLNMTLGLAIVSFVAWLYFVLRYAGIKVILFDLFGNKAEKGSVPAAIYYVLFLIFFSVGLIEVVSIFLRLISLSFRLYGNVFGGENLLASVTGLFSYILPIPFYFLEVLIGLIQAFVFTLLTAIYIGLICAHGEDDYH